jgi:hypothetical protein
MDLSGTLRDVDLDWCFRDRVWLYLVDDLILLACDIIDDLAYDDFGINFGVGVVIFNQVLG